MGCHSSKPAAASQPPEAVDARAATEEPRDGKPETDSADVKHNSAEVLVALRVVKAQLTRSFDVAGKMDPYAVVELVGTDGFREEIFRTSTHWNGHKTPQWDHTSRALLCGLAETIEVQVWDKDLVKSDICGKASISIRSLLGDAAATAADDDNNNSSAGPLQELTLKLGSETTGTVSVQALRGGGVDFTRVDPALFELPARRMGVSGGTAPFFHLRLRDPGAGKSHSHFLGKDLSRAADEITFYEEAMKLQQDPSSGFAPLLDFTFEYAGVVEASVDGAPKGARPKDLLVMRNLRDGFTKLRMLDIKIGQKTAQAGWQGKSRIAATKQAVVDGLTNSACEGYRLEGFDGCPKALASMDPLLDIGGTNKEKMAKKALRIMLQRLNASEILLHFMDTHQDYQLLSEAELTKCLAPVEVNELVLQHIVERLTRLALACRKCPVPQKWIGSSVALGFEVGKLPARVPGVQEDVRRSTHVNIFDWGRSEFNTPERHNCLSESEQRDRARFWSNYQGGIDRLAWEAARAYCHTFSNALEWETITLTLYDFDSMTANDYLDMIQIPVEQTDTKTVKLRDPASLTYSLAWVALPEGSRLRGFWRLTLVGAQKLRVLDSIRGTSDPFCEVTAESSQRQEGPRFRQLSSVKARTLNPVWEEVFDIPVATAPGELEAALRAASPNLVRSEDDMSLIHNLPADYVSELGECSSEEGVQTSPSGMYATRISVVASGNEGKRDALAEWKVRLNQAAKKDEVKPGADPAGPATPPGSGEEETARLQDPPPLWDDDAKDGDSKHYAGVVEGTISPAPPESKWCCM